MPRFVLLEHVWDGVHWDFMLESARSCGPGRSIGRSWRGSNCRPAHCRTIGGSIWTTRGDIGRPGEGPAGGSGGLSNPGLDGGHVQVVLSGDQLVGEVELRQVDPRRTGRRPGTSAWGTWTEAPCGKGGRPAEGPRVRSDRPARRIWPRRI